MANNQPKVEIFKTKNGQWQFRVKRGGHVTLGPEEAFLTRFNCRRAVKSLADICTDKSSSSWVSPLQAACLKALEDDKRAHSH